MLALNLEKAMATHSRTLAWKIPMDGGAWRAVVLGVARSRTRLYNFQVDNLSYFTFTFHFHALEKEMATRPGGLLTIYDPLLVTAVSQPGHLFLQG